MGKSNFDRRMEDRVSGMVYATSRIKEHGLDTFEKELEYRGATYLPMEISIEKCNEIMEGVFTKIYNAYNVAVYKVLHDVFGFGKDRLHRFTDEFNEVVKDIATTDHYGEMLYTFSDYAREFNEKYDLGIDMDKVEEVDALSKRSFCKGPDIHAIELLLHEHGFDDAAKFLIEYLG